MNGIVQIRCYWVNHKVEQVATHGIFIIIYHLDNVVQWNERCFRYLLVLNYVQHNMKKAHLFEYLQRKSNVTIKKNGKIYMES
jgi:hypothetical protein